MQHKYPLLDLIDRLNDTNQEEDRILALQQLSKNPDPKNAIYMTNGLKSITKILREGTPANIHCSHSNITYLAAEILAFSFWNNPTYRAEILRILVQNENINDRQLTPLHLNLLQNIAYDHTIERVLNKTMYKLQYSQSKHICSEHVRLLNSLLISKDHLLTCGTKKSFIKNIGETLKYAALISEESSIYGTTKRFFARQNSLWQDLENMYKSLLNNTFSFHCLSHQRFNLLGRQ